MARIAFITPSLSQNHGIGDYVRLLAEGCVRLGHDVQIHSLNEPHSTEYKSEVIPVGEKSIVAHRWGQLIEYKTKCEESRRLLEAFQPDWVSFHFEFYCYARRGILWGLARHLPAMLKGYRVHLMMHELWVQIHAGGDLREQVKGLVRYVQTRYVIKRIKPLSSHTSVEPYARKLRPLLPDIRLLPIPSNIPVDHTTPILLPAEISATMSGPQERAKYLLVVLFGRIIPEFDGRESLLRIDAFAKQASRQVRLISIGSCGYNDLYWKRLVGQMPPDWQSIKLGIRDPQFISRTLQVCDLALSSTPFELSRKSGTTAAFLEHGLPVMFADHKPPAKEIAVSYPDLYRDQLFFADQSLPPGILTSGHRLAAESYALTVTRQLLADLGL